MKKISALTVLLSVDEGNPPERDRLVRFLAEYTISDVQDPSFLKNGRLHLNENSELAQAILFEIYGAVNTQEGSSFDVAGRPLENPVTEEEKALAACCKKRIAEYPGFFAWLEADYEARVEGNTAKRDAMDKKIAIVRKNNPLPEGVSPTAWQKVKAFFGI